MAAKVHELFRGFDFHILIKDLAQEILGRDVKLESLVDSITLFNDISKDGSTAERRLRMDVM